MVRHIKTKWEWIADTIPSVISNQDDMLRLREIALEIEKNMALAYPFAPTNEFWEEIYPQLKADDHDGLIDRFLYVCYSGADSCIACTILKHVREIPFDADVFLIRPCEFCRYGEIAGICEESSSLYQDFHIMLSFIVRYQSDLDQCTVSKWIPEFISYRDFDNEDEDDIYRCSEYLPLED